MGLVSQEGGGEAEAGAGQRAGPGRPPRPGTPSCVRQPTLYVGLGRSGMLLAPSRSAAPTRTRMTPPPSPEQGRQHPTAAPRNPEGLERRERTVVAGQAFEAVKARHSARRSSMERAGPRPG